MRPRAAAAVAALAFALLTGCGTARTPQPPEADDPFRAPEAASGRSAKAIAFAARDMVVAAHPLAVEAGVSALADGGSAIDAAIAAQLVLNLVEPQSSGLGGGAFLLHYERAGGRLEAWDGRETAPAAATPDQFLDAQDRPLRFLEAADTGLAVGTPGLLRLLEDVHRAHGRLPWARLFEPAIRLAEQGFRISPRLATAIEAAAQRLRGQGGPAAALFLEPDGRPKPAGHLLRNPELAATLRTLAAGGAEAFYRGPLAQQIVDAVRAHPTHPGRLALADLASYRALRREPVCRVYRLRVRVCGVPAPSSGGIMSLQALGLLERFDLARAGPESLDAVHLVAEAYRLAYADRAAYIADPDFVAVPTAGLLDDGYLRSRSAAIDPARSLGNAVAGRPPGATLALGEDRTERPPSTSHLSIVDHDGNAVAMTSSIENAFGSLRMAGGFLLNNQLTDFSFLPADAQGRPIANRVEPGKRPRSAVAPTLVFDLDGELEAVLGSPGGAAIIQYVTKTLIGLVDWRLDMQQAIELPNFGAATSPVTVIEAGTALETLRAGLEARGHTVVSSGTLVSGLHGIVRNAPRGDGPPPPFSRHPGRGLWAGGADPRREGVARGSGAAASEAALGSDAVHDGDAARNGEAVRAGE